MSRFPHRGVAHKQVLQSHRLAAAISPCQIQSLGAWMEVVWKESIPGLNSQGLASFLNTLTHSGNII